MSNPHLAPFKLNDRLLLEPAPNGGWVVCTKGDYGALPTVIGAFSDTDDMLLALNAALATPAAQREG